MIAGEVAGVASPVRAPSSVATGQRYNRPGGAVQRAVIAVLVVLAVTASAQPSPPPPAEPAVRASDGTAGLDLGRVEWLPEEAAGSLASGPDTTPRLTYTLRLDDLVPEGSSFYHESVLAAWESPMGRLEWNVWAMQSCLGQPPPCQGPPALLLGLPMGFEVGPDGRARLIVPGPWSKDWHRFTLEEKFGIMLQEAAALAALIGLVKGL
jgi:hypothetical protein